MNRLPTRRRFLEQLSLAGWGGVAVSGQAAAKALPPFYAFTKHLQGMSYEQIADVVKEAGYSGIEATVRAGGHVEPARVAEDLPKLVEALQQRGLEIGIMASGLDQVSQEQNTEQVLRTAKACGVQRYRLRWIKYDLKRPIQEQIQQWKPQLHDLIQLSAEIGVQPLLQNHSGKDYFGAPLWDVWQLMQAYKPEQWGLALDSYHLTVEAGLSWPIELALVQSHVQMLYLKDVKWLGAGKAESVPLGTGLVSPSMVKSLLQTGFQGPVSIHTEYMHGDVKSAEFAKTCVAAFKRDREAAAKLWLEG
jgi:sugar phosphate isomerase/epimerase